jgi:hypothetical protein
MPVAYTPRDSTHAVAEDHMQAQLIPLNKPAEAKAAGIPVETEDQLRWLQRTAEEKGLTSAFIRIGRRVYLDPVKFHELVRQPK